MLQLSSLLFDLVSADVWMCLRVLNLKQQCLFSQRMCTIPLVLFDVSWPDAGFRHHADKGK